jgi:hypothetical protein
MKIKLNNQAIEIFSGAAVKDVVMMFSKDEWRQVQKSAKAVYDRHGHEVSLNGELAGGEELFIKDKSK